MMFKLDEQIAHWSRIGLEPGDMLGSGTPGDWALGDFWGPIANETRAWLDHLATGKRCVLATPQEARANLETTLAIELAAESRKQVRLPLSR